MKDPQLILSALLGLTQKFASDVSLEDLLQAVTDAALEILPGDHTSIRVLNDGGTELLCGARAGEGSDETPLRFRQGEGVIGWVAEHGWVAYVEDTEQDQRFKEFPEQGFDIRSLIAAPLLSAGKAVGVLAISSATPKAFAPEDESLALLLANCTVPIIDRSRLERLALVDALTLAYNDRYLLPKLREEVQQAGKRGTPLSVLMVDLDNLKVLNHTHGFSVGDRMLQIVAERIRRISPSRDRLVRRGGGTFVLIMPQTSDQSALDLAEAVVADIAGSPISVAADLEVGQTVSIGVATWDGQERTLALLQRAETALVTAKEQGRNRAVQAEVLEAPRE